MTTDLFLGGLAVLTLAAIVIIRMTTDRSETRSFGERPERQRSHQDRSGR